MPEWARVNGSSSHNLGYLVPVGAGVEQDEFEGRATGGAFPVQVALMRITAV